MGENLSDSAETCRLLDALQSGTPRAFEELFGVSMPKALAA